MHSTGSMIMFALEELGFLFEESEGDGKYDSTFFIDHLCGPAMREVLSRINMNRENPIFIHYQITTVADQAEYLLPANIENVWRVAQYYDDGRVKAESMPYNQYHPLETGWRIEGNIIKFTPAPAVAGETVDIVYTPNGLFNPFYTGSGNTATITTTTTVTLPASPAYGRLDKRENAYIGQTLRVLGSSVHEERQISGWDPATRVVTLRRPLVVNGMGSVAAEVVPAASEIFWEAAIYAGAVKYATARNTSQKKYQQCAVLYHSAMKTLMDNLTNMQARVGKHYERRTEDNQTWSNYGDLTFITR